MTRPNHVSSLARSQSTDDHKRTRPGRLAGFWLGLLVVAGCLLSTPGLHAQEEDAEEPDRQPLATDPVVMLSVTSVDRSLEFMRDAFESVDRGDMAGVMDDLMSRAGDLKGFDRTKPVGMALFLPSSLPPQPIPVVYVPVEDMDDLIETMQLGPVRVEKNEEAGEGRYELTGGRGTRHIAVRDGYAFISRNEEFLDADVAILSRMIPQVAAQYDLSLTVRPQSIPPLLRDVFMNFLRNQTEGQLQRRDEEPLSQYLARRANGMSTLEFLERLVKEGEQMTIGMRTIPESSGMEIELHVDATPESEFAEYLDDIGSRASSYASMFSAEEPFTLSVSWMLEEREQTAAHGWIEALEAGLVQQYAGPAGEEAAAEADESAERPLPPELARLLDPLKATIDAGHLDMCVQMRSVDADQFALVGAIHLVGGETFADGLREVLTQVSAREGDFTIELDVAQHAGVAIHRVQGGEARPQDERVYGEKPSLYVGSSGRTLWFAVGQEDAVTELKSSIDAVSEAAGSREAERGYPVQMVVRANQWLGLPPDENADAAGAEIAAEAFTSSNDVLRMELRPTENGVVLRMNLDEGFTRMLMLTLAQRYDQSQL